MKNKISRKELVVYLIVFAWAIASMFFVLWGQLHFAMSNQKGVSSYSSSIVLALTCWFCFKKLLFSEMRLIEKQPLSPGRDLNLIVLVIVSVMVLTIGLTSIFGLFSKILQPITLWLNVAFATFLLGVLVWIGLIEIFRKQKKDEEELRQKPV